MDFYLTPIFLSSFYKNYQSSKIINVFTYYDIFLAFSRKKGILTHSPATWCENILEQNGKCSLKWEASNFKINSVLLSYNFFLQNCNNKY